MATASSRRSLRPHGSWRAKSTELSFSLCFHISPSSFLPPSELKPQLMPPLLREVFPNKDRGPKGELLCSLPFSLQGEEGLLSPSLPCSQCLLLGIMCSMCQALPEDWGPTRPCV